MVVVNTEEMPSASANTMPTGAMGGPEMAEDDVDLPCIPPTPSVASQDAFACIFSVADPQAVASLIEEKKRAARAQAAASAAQESAWKDIGAYYRSRINK